MTTEAELVNEYRGRNPRSRAQGLLRYVHNGSRTKQRGCILCGWEGPSWCAQWPKTRTAIKAETAHVAYHLEAGA